MDFYVYYRVAAQHAGPLLARVAQMQQQLRASGVRPALKRRPGSEDALQTWMEVYPDVPDGFAATLAAAAERAALAELIAGPRNTETFMDLMPCA